MSNDPDGILGPNDTDPGEVALLAYPQQIGSALSVDGAALILRFTYASGKVQSVAIPTGDLNTVARMMTGAIPELERRRQRREEG